jgi:hypothetical protein
MDFKLQIGYALALVEGKNGNSNYAAAKIPIEACRPFSMRLSCEPCARTRHSGLTVSLHHRAGRGGCFVFDRLEDGFFVPIHESLGGVDVTLSSNGGSAMEAL